MHLIVCRYTQLFLMRSWSDALYNVYHKIEHNL